MDEFPVLLPMLGAFLTSVEMPRIQRLRTREELQLCLAQCSLAVKHERILRKRLPISKGVEMPNEINPYGNWIIVASIIALALFFITKYIPVKTKFEKRTGGALVAFAVALFTEMFGFPLTIYLLSSFFGIQIPLTHQYGHLFAYALTLLGIDVLYGWIIAMGVSTIIIGIGLGLIMDGWRKVYHGSGELITTGVYGNVRHPQYLGIFIVMTGFLIQWPTLITLIMYPFLVVSYYKLAKREESDVLQIHGEKYIEYMRTTPMFFPRILDHIR